MRIVSAMFGRGLGGIEQAMLDYCEALRLSGHEPLALVHPKSSIRAALGEMGIETHCLSNIGAWDPLAAWKLRRLLARLAPDACIAHGNRAVSLLKAANAPRLVGVLHNYAITHADLHFVFYPTQHLLAHANESEKSGRHLYFVPNLVRVPADAPLRVLHSPPVIGAMGRFVAKKGFDLWIEALALLKARNVSFTAELAGDGEEKQALQTLADARGLADTLRFTGWAAHPKAFLDRIDLFCLPSLHEPFGIVLLEAMAQALPAVALASEGPSEIVQDGIDGLLVYERTPAALADTLARMIADPQQARLLGRNAYDSVRRRYDLPVVAHKLDLALRALRRL